MGRRKKKDLELENELSEYIELHKFSIISSALYSFEEDGIYDTFLFKDKYEDVPGEGKLKARNIAQLLLDESHESAEGLREFELAYKYCYDKAKNFIAEDWNATEEMCD